MRIRRCQAVVFIFLSIGLGHGMHADELTLKDGQILEGSAVGTDGKRVTFRMAVGKGYAEIPYPLTGVQTLRFERQAELETLLKNHGAEEESRLRFWWEKRSPYLKIPQSDAWEIGLAYVRALLSRRTKKAAVEAVSIARQVESECWSEKGRSEASRLRLSALAAAGKVEQALAEAERMETVSGLDEEALASARVQARLAQASLAFSQWEDLEKEWPKWKQMPDKRKECSVLVNRALDGFLFPVVFHPELSMFCAEGLCRAAEIHLRLEDRASALAYANEVLANHPEAEFKERAERLAKQARSTPVKPPL